MSPNGSQARSNSWKWIASIWLGIALVDAMQTVIVQHEQGTHHDWFKLFRVLVLFWLPWALATAPVMRLGHRLPLLHLKPLFNWIAHLVACFTIALVFSMWTLWLGRFVDLYGGAANSEPLMKLLWQRFLNGSVAALILYAGILVVSYVVDSRARLADQQVQTARLNEQLSTAKLDALRKQIEPHFLFNTLNAVSGLVRAGRGEDAVTMIAGLSDFLRHTMDNSSRLVVSLSEELQFAEKYLSIQKVRFADRLRLDLDVPRDLYQAQVPSLILQPIVENAVKHGIARRAQGGDPDCCLSRSQ
jgi:two-component system, LytTR family, sensor kinase